MIMGQKNSKLTVMLADPFKSGLSFVKTSKVGLNNKGDNEQQTKLCILGNDLLLAGAATGISNRKYFQNSLYIIIIIYIWEYAKKVGICGKKSLEL